MLMFESCFCDEILAFCLIVEDFVHYGGCMLLAFDIGNSSISVGVFELPVTKNADQEPKLRVSFKISNKSYSSDEYTLLIRDFLARSDIRTYADTDDNSSDCVLDCAVISSVVPELTELLVVTAEKLCGHTPLLIDQGVRTGFGIRIKNPEQLGSDIVSNIAAALHYVQPPFVVLDMGTASTLTVVGTNVEVLGSIIIPGLKVSMTALTESAALLSAVPLDYNEELIGRDTQSSIRSGVMNGNVYMLDGFVRNIREKILTHGTNEKLGLIATGGLAKRVIPYMRNRFVYHENLTLEGEAYLYLRNRKSR